MKYLNFIFSEYLNIMDFSIVTKIIILVAIVVYVYSIVKLYKIRRIRGIYGTVGVAVGVLAFLIVGGIYTFIRRVLVFIFYGTDSQLLYLPYNEIGCIVMLFSFMGLSYAVIKTQYEENSPRYRNVNNSYTMSNMEIIMEYLRQKYGTSEVKFVEVESVKQFTLGDYCEARDKFFEEIDILEEKIEEIENKLENSYNAGRDSFIEGDKFGEDYYAVEMFKYNDMLTELNGEINYKKDFLYTLEIIDDSLKTIETCKKEIQLINMSKVKTSEQISRLKMNESSINSCENTIREIINNR